MRIVASSISFTAILVEVATILVEVAAELIRLAAKRIEFGASRTEFKTNSIRLLIKRVCPDAGAMKVRAVFTRV